MGLIKFNKIGISGISAAVPKNIIDNYTFKGLFTNKEIENTIKTTGIVERRFASKDICSSDLCVLSAEKLLTEMNVDRESIDVLIFITQTPDYLQPATAPRIQHRLKLSKNTASFDINMACSGYIYGLSTAFAYCNTEGINSVLLLVGETMSKIVSKKIGQHHYYL